MVQHQVYTPNFGVIYQGQQVIQVDPHFGVLIDTILLGVIFRFKPRYLVQTWTWTLWYNQAQMFAETPDNNQENDHSI